MREKLSGVIIARTHHSQSVILMLETSLFVATLATLGMLSPGPDFFLVIKNAARYRRPAAMMTALGVILGVATHMSYCVAGLAVVITTTPWLFNFLKYAGACYLIWIGIQALLSRGESKLSIDNTTLSPITLKAAFWQGYLCNLLNPKATLFFLAVFTQILQINSGVGENCGTPQSFGYLPLSGGRCW
ncbi:LysE type translocator [Yersinia aldovae ATCC 35236]|nr:LysE type translocator [Yersinia aldovae ATCC 35236]